MRVESIVYNGRTYRRYPDSKHQHHRRYYQRGGGNGFLHRDVWTDANGPIPEGMVIHHIDEDTGNNDIANLACLTPKEHRAEHPLEGEAYDRQTQHLDRIRHLAAGWHSSEAGQAFHSENGRKAAASREPRDRVCKCCARTFQSLHRGPVYFCGSACGQRFTIRGGIADADYVDVTRADTQCHHCGGTFAKRGTITQKFCSPICKSRARHNSALGKGSRLQSDG